MRRRRPARSHAERGAPALRRGAAGALAIVVTAAGCSGALLTKRDYRASLHEHYLGSPELALAKLPSGERGTFIPALERAHLSVLAGDPQLEELERHAKALDERVRYDVSRELSTFFYAETPGGYYASEHEIIWAHVVLSWGYSQRGEPGRACAEAKRASELLSLPWITGGHFDDALLRVVLAGLWARCGAWDEARVDLRRAAALDADTAWARELADREAPPRELVLVLGGVGPSPRWDPELELNPIRGARNVVLSPQGRRSSLALADGAGEPIPLRLTPTHQPGTRATGSATMPCARSSATPSTGTARPA